MFDKFKKKQLLSTVNASIEIQKINYISLIFINNNEIDFSTKNKKDIIYYFTNKLYINFLGGINYTEDAHV